MTYDEWFETYKPFKNNIDLNAPFDGYMWETYGHEEQQVMCSQPNQIWTIVDGDDGLVLVDGYHYVNRFGYFICEVPALIPPLVEIPLDIFDQAR
jgi:hypothetical protein